MSNALLVCNIPNVLDEDQQTEEMLAELNRQTSLNRNCTEKMSLNQQRAAAKYAHRRYIARKWTAVKQVAFCTLCTAALYGFEQIGLPHSIALLGMLFLASYAAAIAVTEVWDDILRSRIKRKVIRR